MLDWLGDTLGSVMTGGFLGALGSCFTAWMQVSAKKLEYAHEEKMAEIDIQMQQAELESVERQSSIEWTGKTNVAEAKALAAS